MNTRQRYDLLLSVYLSSRGFGYVLAEGAMNPVDWGLKDIRGPKKNEKCLNAIATIVERYRPDVLILENVIDPNSHRSERVRALNAMICVYADMHGIPVTMVAWATVREAFAPYGASSKDEIAEVVAQRLAITSLYLPPVRRPWDSENNRMALFCAAALLLTAESQLSPSAS